MAKKSGFEEARASVRKAIKNLEETVSGMVGFDEPDKKEKKSKTKRKAKQGRAKKARGR